MKIIGKAGPSHHPTLLAELTVDELARICGFFYKGADFESHLGSLGAIDDRREVRLGIEIPVSAFFDRLSAIRQKQEELERLARTMHALADLIEQQSPAAIFPAVPKPAP